MDSATLDTDPKAHGKALRQALGAFATGVTVVTTCDAQGQRHGLTVNSFASVSLDPPLILWSQSHSAPSHPVFRQAPHFVVNVLAHDQAHLSARFARGGQDKFNSLAVSTGLGGCPVLTGCVAHFECSLVREVAGGDHTIFIGQVERFERNDREPLIFANGRFIAGQPIEPAVGQEPASATNT